MSDQAVISAVGLTKVYRDFWYRARVRAVCDLDFEVRPGEIFGLLGPNGSGKSTTIKMILGLLHPTRGRVAVFGRPPSDVRIKARIGYLPEESYLYRYLSGREVLDFYGSLFQIPRRGRRRRTEELLEMVGLKSAARRPVGEYSKGMARRIGLAQALINDPDLLILDEPTSGLDPIGARLVKETIVRLGRVYHKSILLSSHLLADVEEVCERVTILYGGRAQVTGRMDDVLSRRDQIQITCERPDAETLAQVERILRRDGRSLTVTTPRDRLESLFLRIVQDARSRQLETSGAAERGEVAAFLGQEARPEAVLASLVGAAAQPVGPPQPPPTPPPPPAADLGVLEHLTGAAPGAPPPEPDAARPTERPDEDVLRRLTADSEGPGP